MEFIYYGMKIMLFASLIRAFVIAEPLKRHVLAMSVLYTVLVAFLSFLFFLTQFESPNYRLWLIWLGVNLVMTYIFFKLLTTFDESAMFWVVLPFAVVVIFNEPNLVPFWQYLLNGTLYSGKRIIRGQG